MADLDDKLPPLERYFRILETLQAFPEGLTLGELGKILMVPKASIHRLLQILQRSSLVAPGRTAGTYVLGDRVRRLAQLGASSEFIAALTRQYLRQLVSECGETCYIGRREDYRVRSIVMESPEAPWRGFVLPGKIMQAHATACSKAILAYQTDDFTRQALCGPLEALTPRTRTTVPAVMQELKRVRQNGYATCIGEVDEGLAAIAVPIEIAPAGVAYALGVVGPLPRITALLDNGFPRRMIAIAAALAAALERSGSEIPESMDD